ncbi:MAG: hypothetical protein V7752_19735 [Halopseudomonas sp.]
MCSQPKQYMIDVNDRYQKGVGLITSLSTAALVLPIIFLKDIINISSINHGDAENSKPELISIAEVLTDQVYLGWQFLSAAITFGVIYYYLSAKWVKLAWGETPDIFWIDTNQGFVEFLLDISYLAMFVFFALGLYNLLNFMLNYLPPTSA